MLLKENFILVYSKSKKEPNINNYINSFISSWNNFLALFNPIIINVSVDGSWTALINFT